MNGCAGVRKQCQDTPHFIQTISVIRIGNMQLASREQNSAATLPVSRTLREGDVVKFCQATPDHLEIESVIIPMGARENVWHTLCVSSQIGCKRGCTFCQTGQMGLLRNLTVDEILGQVVAAREELGARVRNVVFMGMGEPMDNLDNVIEAITRMHEDRDHQIPRRRITVSTVGKCDGIRQLAALRWRRLNLAVSLNAPNDEIRSQIMPINRVEPMAMLREAISGYPVRAGGHVLIEYVLIKGVNDAPEHARQLADYLRGLPTCVNVIPYNPRENSPYEAPTDEMVEAFMRILMDLSQLVFRRNTKGRTAMAACGQLGNLTYRRGLVGVTSVPTSSQVP
jgi:23S rRNA (adenine2503-C2)-methyltransferase